MNRLRECLVMVKPAGPACNLKCEYCYYLEKQSLFPRGQRRMQLDLLESYIEQRIACSVAPSIHFEWHGGEPTILGLDYFREIARMQRKHIREGRRITNGLQTNGIRIDDDWADFLAREKYSVGLSIDGPPDLHDECRKTADGKPTHTLVVEAYAGLKKRGVFVNILCVLHKGNAGEPDRVYDFFRGLGAAYIQFLPLGLSPRGTPMNVSAKPELIGAFLCRVFDLWIRSDVGRVVIQTFDEAFRPMYGAPHALCVHRETCGDVAVLEHDGSFYACDHFVDEEHLFGNLKDRSLADMSNDPRLLSFGNAKRDTLPQVCLECDVISSCNGGCPKDRFSASSTVQAGLNCLCTAYKSIFRHSKAELTRLAAHMKAGRPQREFKAL